MLYEHLNTILTFSHTLLLNFHAQNSPAKATELPFEFEEYSLPISSLKHTLISITYFPFSPIFFFFDQGEGRSCFPHPFLLRDMFCFTSHQRKTGERERDNFKEIMHLTSPLIFKMLARKVRSKHQLSFTPLSSFHKLITSYWEQPRPCIMNVSRSSCWLLPRMHLFFSLSYTQSSSYCLLPLLTQETSESAKDVKKQ